MSKDLKEESFDELGRIVACLSGKPYLANYIFAFIHRQGVERIPQITPLSKSFRERLTERGYYISQLRTIDKLNDPDGTVKYLFELGDGERIETVALLDRGRMTLCVSTQVGCAMDCVFCATGRIKLSRNLTAAEIVDQVITAEKDGARISNVVYMGMGEPLLNYDAVLKSVRILNHPAGKNIGIRRLTVSTCGIAPAIRRLADEDVQPRLAISLNAPTDAIRSKLMPVNEKYPLPQLLDAVRFYQMTTGRRVTFEYVMIGALNDTVTHARLLVKLLRGVKCNVNLIEYNPHSGCDLTGSGQDRIERFKSVLDDTGIETTVRLRMGRSINAACGQLGAGWMGGAGTQ
jgi:23S rRNA (adenine2503-C2)-methyltransferase